MYVIHVQLVSRKDGIKNYKVIDSNYPHVRKGAVHTQNDLNVVGSQVPDLTIQVFSKGGWSPLNPPQASERSEKMTDTTTTTVVEDQVATPVKKTAKPKVTGARGTTKKSGAKKGGTKKGSAKGTKGTKGTKTKKGAKDASRNGASRVPTKDGNTLNDNQITTLKYLVKHGETTRADLRDKTGNFNLGIPPMVEAGLVSATPYEGERGYYFDITAKGKKELKKQK